MDRRKSKGGDHVRISKYNNIFSEGHVPNWSEEVFVIKKVKNTLRWAYLISDFKGEEIIIIIINIVIIIKTCT